MSNFCNPCRPAENILTCTDKLEVGSISLTNTKVYVLITNHTSGKSIILPSTSDSSGEVVVAVYSNMQLMDGHNYSVTILKDGFKNLNDIHNIIIGTETVSCVSFNAHRLVDEANNTLVLNQKITLI